MFGQKQKQALEQAKPGSGGVKTVSSEPRHRWAGASGGIAECGVQLSGEADQGR